MDSDSPAAPRIAGRTSGLTGISFTAVAGTFKSEFDAFDAHRSGASSSRRSHLHSAGGHGL